MSDDPTSRGVPMMGAVPPPLGPFIEILSIMEFLRGPNIADQLGLDLQQGAYPITSKLHGFSAPQGRADSWIS